MAAKKKAVSKKAANEGRGVLCRDCYVKMPIQLTLDGGQEYVCPKCERRWPFAMPPELRHPDSIEPISWAEYLEKKRAAK